MADISLPTVYEPSKVEDRWYKYWLDNNCFTADNKSKKKAYSIVMPPPNVTGVLTMGHVLNNTLQDILCRKKRMEGYEVLWLPGTDHAGIATQTVVEKALKHEGVIKHRDDIGREKFVERVWDWKDRHGGIIIKQLKKLGCSCDWTREVFTMDGLDKRHPNPRINYSRCVQKVFIDIYKKGLIYRGKKMINWCPVSMTALSDEEVVMKETEGHLWYIKYPLIDKNNEPSNEEFIVVATTRPETMLGDEAVAVHPSDKRYKSLIGRRVLLPLKNKHIPIIADELVEKEFGTGAVKVTPAHDPADYEIALRHALPITEVIGKDAKMTAAAGEDYEGMDRFECRRAVVADLEEWGLMLKVEPYRHNVGFSQRADVPVEPRLSEQWFLKYPSVKKSIKAVESGKIRFYPNRWVKVYSHWMNNIRDWCISRQLWWGHRIPAWYCRNGRSEVPNPKSQTNSIFQDPNSKQCPPIVSIERPARCPVCGGTDFEQDPDVLDTWFSAWLWPFATMGWPEKTQDLKKFYPTTDLVTGPDIIFFWVARMIMAGFEFMGEKPFNNVYFTGIIRDALGRKMSKSLGNSPDPLDLIDKYGADGLRFGLMMIAPKGQDILFSEDRVEVGRNFMNKLWNASRFVLMNVKEAPKYLSTDSELRTSNFKLNLADKWILNRLNHTIKDVKKALDGYQFDSAARMLYQFVWREFCDWYIEISKSSLYQDKSKDEKEKTQSLLIYLLDNIVRLLHPYAPFITEEIWQKLPVERGGLKTIVFAKYPRAPKKIPFEKEAKEMQLAMDVIATIRNIRGEHNISPAKKLNVILYIEDKTSRAMIEDAKSYIFDLAKAGNLSIMSGGSRPRKAVAAVAGPVEIFVPFEGIINIEAERARLSKEIAKVEKNIGEVNSKLSNERFVERAPREVVEKERARLDEAVAELEKLKAALKKLDS